MSTQRNSAADSDQGFLATPSPGERGGTGRGLASLARPEIRALRPYPHATWEPELTRLHANESPWRSTADTSGAGLNRYPEPQPRTLIERVAALYQVPADTVLVTRGSDDAIDLLVRVFCRAGQDAILICPPTFGMYAVAAGIQGAHVVEVPLRAAEGFAVDEAAVLRACGPEVKLVFLCSPNNPTGNLLSSDAILRIAEELGGRALVVVDEAYIEFATRESVAAHRSRVTNLCILRTLSKAFSLAGARCGTLIADPEVICLIRKVTHPYALAQPTVEAVMRLLEPAALAEARERCALIRDERERLMFALGALPTVKRVWPSRTNFLLTAFTDASAALERARRSGFLVRDLRGDPAFPDSVRITVGTPEVNDRLLEAWS